ncbi:28602_t:CDS:1, partial [Gigaspora margarita]
STELVSLTDSTWSTELTKPTKLATQGRWRRQNRACHGMQIQMCRVNHNEPRLIDLYINAPNRK